MDDERQLAEVINDNSDEIVATWVASQQRDSSREIVPQEELEAQARLMLREIVAAFEDAARLGQKDNALRALLSRLSQTRARQGFTPRENARFLLGLKEAMLPVLLREYRSHPAQLVQLVARLGSIVDELALFTFEVYLQGRERYIREQQEAILELSTPVLEVWDDILALPLVGSLDTHRAQLMTETLLEAIVEQRAHIVLIDLTGVSVVDTAVARHLIQTIKAVRLLGASTIVVGIAPQVAQTMVQLGVDLGDVMTRGSLGAGLRLALEESGWQIRRRGQDR